MEIHDNNPERRNLVLLSMSIIAFYVGSAEIKGSDGITLSLVKLEFADPAGLAALAWMILVWFAFRYFIVSRPTRAQEIYRELHGENYGLTLFHRFLSDFLHLQDPDNFKICYYHNTDNGANPFDVNTLVIGKCFTSVYTSRGSMPEFKIDNDRMVSAKSPLWKIRMVYWTSLAILFWKKPFLTGYYIPYVLFWWAVILGLINRFNL